MVILADGREESAARALRETSWQRNEWLPASFDWCFLKVRQSHRAEAPADHPYGRSSGGTFGGYASQDPRVGLFELDKPLPCFEYDIGVQVSCVHSDASTKPHIKLRTTSSLYS